MGLFQIRQGRDIKLKGVAEKQVVALPLPAKVAVCPDHFRNIRWRPVVKEGDPVKVGTPVLENKDMVEIKVVAPASGKIKAINRGEKRVLLEVIIETDGRQDAVSFKTANPAEIRTMAREEIIRRLLEGGVWPCIRQRPFSRIANPQQTPKSIFVQAMNTEPLALDVDVILQNREAEFQIGLDVLKRLTPGDVHLCAAPSATSKALTQSQNVHIHQFAGPHPAGNVSTHIHHVDPINKGDVVWYIRAEDVLRVAHLLTKGIFSSERFVAVTGEGAAKRVYKKTVIGAPVAHILENATPAGMRFISGSVLAGTSVGAHGYLGFYDSQVTVIPEGGKRELLGWIMPGFDKLSFSRTFPTSFVPARDFSLDTDTHGSERAVVFNHVYDQYVPLDVMTFFLMRAVYAGDIEEAEKLGILECDDEDFALCSFACPSKIDVGAVIRRGLDLVEKEG